MPQVFQIFEVHDALNAGREVYAAYFPRRFSFQGKTCAESSRGCGAEFRTAQKIRFEFHTGDYGCRFRRWRFDSILDRSEVRTILAFPPNDAEFETSNTRFFFILKFLSNRSV